MFQTYKSIFLLYSSFLWGSAHHPPSRERANSDVVIDWTKSEHLTHVFLEQRAVPTHNWSYVIRFHFVKLRTKGHRKRQTVGIEEITGETLELVTFYTVCLTRVWVSEGRRCRDVLQGLRVGGTIAPWGSMRLLGPYSQILLVPGSVCYAPPPHVCESPSSFQLDLVGTVSVSCSQKNLDWNKDIIIKSQRFGGGLVTAVCFRKNTGPFSSSPGTLPTAEQPLEWTLNFWVTDCLPAKWERRKRIELHYRCITLRFQHSWNLPILFNFKWA